MSVTKSSFWFTLGTLFSRVTGLIREAVLGGFFGASSLLDAFFIAFRIPNLFREMLAEGALASSFTKVFSENSEKDQKTAFQLLADTLVLFSLFSAVFCGLGILAAPYLVDFMSLKVDPGEREYFIRNAVSLTKILFPYLGLTIISSIVMGALHERGRFFLSAISPSVFNLGYVVGAIFIAAWLDETNPAWIQFLQADPRGIGLAIGVLLGGLGQFLMQAQALRKPWKEFSQHIKIRVKLTPEVKKVLYLMGPAAIAASSGPINVIVNTNFATALGEGAVSWLIFASRILQLPIGLFGVAIGVAILPALSKSLARSKQKVDKAASLQLQNGLELVIWIMLACFVFIYVNRLEIIQLLFTHGKFSLADTQATSDALQGYSFGILAYGLIKVMTSFYYAIEKTTFAMKISLFSIAINFAGNYFLVEQFGHVGLAYTSSITLTFNGLCLLLGAIYFGAKFEGKKVLRSAQYLTVGCLLSLFLASQIRVFLLAAISDWTTPLKLNAAILLFANGVVITFIFGFFLSILFSAELGSVRKKVRNSLKRKS